MADRTFVDTATADSADRGPPSPHARIASAPAPEQDQGHALAVASQAQLIWWRFLRHRMAVIGAVLLGVLYLMALLCEFVAPYDPNWRDTDHVLLPPQVPRVRSDEGLHLRPFVFATEMTRDPVTRARAYRDDRGTRHGLRLLPRGQPYRLWGIFPAERHLFGVEEGGVIHLFGTDNLGRDMFSRIVYGARISLSIGLLGVFVSFLLGLATGALSGLVGGWVDNLIQRIIEIIRSFPEIPLWMGLSAALPPKWSPVMTYFGITIILSFIGWTSLARVARGKILALKNEDFVVAAGFSGASTARVIGVHLVPSFFSHIIASLTLAIPSMILGETSLSFLGLGLRDPVISWGVLLFKSQNIHTIAFTPWLFIPALFVIVAVLCFNFVGDGLRDAADPYATVAAE